MAAELVEFGRVVAVSVDERKGALVSAVSAGAATLTLDDTADFDEDGGSLLVGTDVVTYTGVDDDAGVITLAAGLPHAAAADDPVYVWDPAGGHGLGAVAVDKVALVQFEGDDAQGDPVEVDVDIDIYDRLTEGVRGSLGERVRCEFDGEDWLVKRVDGLTPYVDGGSIWNPHSAKTVTKSISNATLIQVNGWTDVETDGIDFATSTWTIQYPGAYALTLSGVYAKNATGRRQLAIRLNGSPYVQRADAADPTDSTYLNATYQDRFKVGDQLTVWAFQNSGAALSLTSANFSIYRIST